MHKLYAFFALGFLTIFPLAAQDEPAGYGDKIMELNKKIKAARKEAAECVKTKGEKDAECAKKEAELTKLRAEREAVVKSIPEGKGLRPKIRKEIARDRMQERRENATEAVEDAE